MKGRTDGQADGMTVMLFPKETRQKYLDNSGNLPPTRKAIKIFRLNAQKVES